MESECKRRCEDTDETGSGCLGCALVNSASAGLWVLPSVGSAMVWVERSGDWASAKNDTGDAMSGSFPSSATGSRGSGGSGGGASTSLPKTSTMEEMQKRRDLEKPPGSSNSSLSRKHIDFRDPITPRHNSGGRPPPSPSVSKVITDALRSRTEARLRSLSSAAQSTSSTSNKASFSISAKMSSPAHPNEPPNPLKKAEVETSSASSTSDSGSDSLGSITESTVTSDEGFTDYLSDESEAELQRQAEAKAAQFAQNEAEELEFRQARQAMANIGLRPPKSWTGKETERTRKPWSTRI
ncbi:hypothetical protein B0H11DRAFT_2083135 [Mycena galericulata]|nr:hypothetical protein B0H11DRAFT_2083135 [Mycena galericulata]